MIKAEEFRIGNILSTSLKSGMGRSVIKKIGCQDIVRIKENTGSFIYNPIPLTEEWILRFGFEKFIIKDEIAKNGYRILNKIELQDVGDGYFRLKHFYMGQIGAENTHVRYVHQLQNLYFALTGEELTIKP